MFQVATHYIQQYTTNVNMLLTQKGGKLAPFVTMGSHTGTGAQVVQQIGTTKPIKNLGRYQDTPLIDMPTAQRWVFPNDYDWGTLIDDQDKLKMLLDPTSPYTMSAVNAMRRAQDDEILQAFYASSPTGTNGASTTAFPAGQKVGVNVGGTNSKLNVAKLRAAKVLLMAAGVDLESEAIYCAINSADHDALLNEIEVKSTDFNSKPALVDGRLSYFLGINFVHVEYTDSASYSADTVTAVGSATRFVPMWVKSGMYLGTWKDVAVSVAPRPDKRFATQVYCTTTLGATRVEEKRVVQIATTG